MTNKEELISIAKIASLVQSLPVKSMCGPAKDSYPI